MYPKVKVRDQQDGFLQPLDEFESISKDGSLSPEYQVNSPPSTIRIPKSYTPIALMPMVSDFKGTKKNDEKVDEDEKTNIRASSILRPRAVLSSPDNDGLMGNKKSLKADRPSALKNRNMIPNRHAQCKVIIPSHIITEGPTNTRRKSKESTERKIDFKGKKGSESIF